MAAVKTDVLTVTAWDGTPTVTAGSFGKMGVSLAGFSVIEAADAEEVVQLVAGTPCGREALLELGPFSQSMNSCWLPDESFQYTRPDYYR
jgi:hypothetical protein